MWSVGVGRAISLDRPVVLAILNLTPDSFSDGGAYATVGAALEAAASFVASGAHALDIGGESTRPGSRRVDAAEQARRILPVVRAIRADRAFDGTAITVDTTLAAVARAALDAGADGINDVSGATEDPAMLPLAAERRAGLILMHRLAPPEQDSYSDRYMAEPDYSAHGGVTEAIRSFLERRATDALAAGVGRSSIALDPGLGFGKSVEQNLELIRRTAEISRAGFPVVSGLSRKSFVARAAGLGPRSEPATQRLEATIALSAAHRRLGASIFRVHDPGPVGRALAAADALLAASHPLRAPTA